MHLTLKKETTKPAGKKFLQQQAKFGRFIEYYKPLATAPGAEHALPRRVLSPLATARERTRRSGSGPITRSMPSSPEPA